MRDVIDNKKVLGDEILSSLRPLKLDDYIGQSIIKEVLKVYISTAKMRLEPLDHVLFYGPPGLGKTTLANIIANEMGSKIFVTSGPVLKRPGDLAKILTCLNPFDVLFIDEIHRIPKVVEEMLYSAMEDYVIDIIIDSNNDNEILRVDLPPFTLVGATTRFGDLTHPLRDRFGIIQILHYYSLEELCDIIKRTSKIFNYAITSDACLLISRSSRGTPRIANRLFKRVRDFAQYLKKDIIDEDLVLYALNKLNVDSLGLDSYDLKYLDILISSFNGGPVGIDSIASIMGVESITLEDVNEPYLLKEGFINRTKRGRVATDKAYLHLGIKRRNEVES